MADVPHYAAQVRHISKNQVEIVPSTGWSVVLFNVQASPDIVVVSDDGLESIRMALVKPKTNEYMTVRVGTETDPRAVVVEYGDK